MKTTRHSLKALAAGVLALCLTLTTLPAASAALSDVADSDWYAQAVQYCWDNGMIEDNGDGTFSPNSPMTRAMVAYALYVISDRPEVDLTPEEHESGAADDEEQDETAPLTSPFSDVELDDPYADAILWAWFEGLVSGYDDGRFRPEEPVNREQFAVILWHTLGEPLAQIGAPFADKSSIASWSIDAVEWAWYVGLLSGKPGNLFDPTGDITRAEAATILMHYDQIFIHPPEDAGDSSGIAPNTYDGDAFVVKNGFLTYQGDAPSYVGIDVSSHQGQIDWAQVAAAGVDFAMIRVGYRGYTVGSINKDAYFDYNIQNALANGLEVGVYFFSQATTEEEALEEARQTLDWIRGYDITYPVVFDWEEVDEEGSRSQGADGQTVTQCALAFCGAVEDAGYLAMTYGSPSKIYAGGLDLSQLQDYPFWLAHYTTGWTPTSFRHHYHMWQYSSNGTVPGIQGRVDLDLCLTDFSLWPD